MPEFAARLFLFDIDGTLLSTGGAGRRSFERSAREALEIDGELQGISMGGQLDRIIFQNIARRYRPELTLEEISSLWQRFAKYYLEYLRAEAENPDEWALMPGVVPLLEFCASRGSLALLTGNIREGAYLKVSRMGLADFFPTGGFGEEAISRKELACRTYRAAAAYFQTDFPCQRTYVIGDTVFDIEAGKAIGARTVAVATGTVSFAELEKASPDLVVENFASNTDPLYRFLSH